MVNVRYQSTNIETLMQYVSKTENAQQHKWGTHGCKLESISDWIAKNVLKEMGSIHGKAKQKTSWTPKQKKQGLSGPKKSNHGLWMTGLKWCSVMNGESALGKLMKQELMFDAIPIICVRASAWRKQAHFRSHG